MKEAAGKSRSLVNDDVDVRLCVQQAVIRSRCTTQAVAFPLAAHIMGHAISPGQSDWCMMLLRTLMLLGSRCY